MAKVAVAIEISSSDRIVLERISNSRSEEARRVFRARIILECSSGKQIIKIAKEFGTRPNTVINYRNRFTTEGIKALDDRPRSGKPSKYTQADFNRILAKLDETPPAGMTSWDGGTLASTLGISDDAVWRFLRKNNICLRRQRSWCVSTDPEFSAKAADIVGLYLDPPENAIVICVDEKPSIQALSRATGYVQASNGKILRAYKSTYRRNGVLNLFGALEVATGAVKGKVTEKKTRNDFLQFMDELLAEYPNQEGRSFHVILDNYCTHKKNQNWLESHPNVSFHFTPTSASWLNQVEIWFGIFSRKVLRGASHDSKKDLKDAIEKYIQAYDENKKPFKWRKREVRASQIRNSIANLCN